MIARIRLSRWMIALGFGVGGWPASSGATPRSPPPQPSIVWDESAGSGAIIAVRVVDIPEATVDAMRSASETDPRWLGFLTIHLSDDDGSVPPDRPAIFGSYRVMDGETLRFTPRFPLGPNRHYRAKFDLDGPLGEARPLVVVKAGCARPPTPRTLVARIEPTDDRLPENLLKLYLYFDAPMGRGEAYGYLQLVDAEGKPLDHPFLELGEELWDPTQTRLTILLDPGRIKRGLRPHEELGPILVAGRSYTLNVDPSWRDAGGRPLGAPASKTFRAGPADETSPDPKTWAITPPRAGSPDPLVIRFKEALDRATAASGLTLLDPRGAELAGTAEATPDGAAWRFTPEAPWLAGAYSLRINPDLEDLAGNSIRRPFEVDVQRDIPTIPDARRILVPILIAR